MPKMSKPPKLQHNSMKKLDYQTRLTLAVQSLPFKAGACVDVRVEHDDSCPMRKGRSKCWCRPNIYLDCDGAQFEVLPNGEPRRVTNHN